MSNQYLVYCLCFFLFCEDVFSCEIYISFQIFLIFFICRTYFQELAIIELLAQIVFVIVTKVILIVDS